MRIARPFGIPVYISPYWFLIAGLFVFLYGNSAVLAGSSEVRYVVAAAFVVLLYVSVLIHELSHSLVARGFGLPVRRILLYPLGGFSEIEQEPPTPGREFLVSAAGPLLSLVLAGLGYAVLAGHPPGWPARTAHPATGLGQPAGRDLQPAARAAAGRRPDASRRGVEGDRQASHGHHRRGLGRTGARGGRPGRADRPAPRGG